MFWYDRIAGFVCEVSALRYPVQSPAKKDRTPRGKHSTKGEGGWKNFQMVGNVKCNLSKSSKHITEG